MCLTLNERFLTQQSAENKANIWFSIARKEITVYKELEKHTLRGKDSYTSPYRNFPYKKGEHYYQTGNWCTTKIFPDNNGNFRINVFEGLHSYLNPYFAHKTRNRVIIKMVIPAGAKYFLGEDCEIVSDQLIWK